MDTVMVLNRKLQNPAKKRLPEWIFLRFSPAKSVLLYRHYFNSFGNFRVFSIQIYQLYAYHIFWARVAGRLIWACFSSKIPNAAPYPRDVKILRPLNFIHNCFNLQPYSKMD